VLCCANWSKTGEPECRNEIGSQNTLLGVPDRIGEPEYRNEIGSQNTLLGVPDRIGEPEYRNEIGGQKNYPGDWNENSNRRSVPGAVVKWERTMAAQS